MGSYSIIGVKGSKIENIDDLNDMIERVDKLIEKAEKVLANHNTSDYDEIYIVNSQRLIVCKVK